MSAAGGKADEISTITDIASQAGGGVSHWSALIAWTPRVSSSCASVKARFGNSGTATASPSGPYSVSTMGSPGPCHVTTARCSVVSVTCGALARLVDDMPLRLGLPVYLAATDAIGDLVEQVGAMSRRKLVESSEKFATRLPMLAIQITSFRLGGAGVKGPGHACEGHDIAMLRARLGAALLVSQLAMLFLAAPRARGVWQYGHMWPPHDQGTAGDGSGRRGVGFRHANNPCASGLNPEVASHRYVNPGRQWSPNACWLPFERF